MKEMSTESNKIHFPAIDIVRFLCAFLVVAIHTAPFSSYHQTISNGFNNFLCRVAVPFYFGATGFFLCEKYKNSEFKFSYILPYLKKILIIYIAWTILYLSKIILMIRTFEGGITAGIMERIKLTVFSGSIVHLWYFTALLFAVSFLAFLFSRQLSMNE